MDPSLTRASLLSRVRDPGDADAWRQFEARYGDLIVRYARARGLAYCDAEDVRQVVLLSLSRSLRGFRYAPERGRFRDYLGRVVRNAVARWASREKEPCRCLDDREGDAGGPAAPDDAWEREWMHHHFRLAMAAVRRTCDPRTVEVFDRLTRGERAEALAAEYRMSPGAIYQLKSRVGQRLRELIAEQVRQEEEPRD